MTSIVLANDHPLVRQGLCAVLDNTPGIDVADADNGHDAVRLCVEHHPDVTLLDLQMPGLHGIDASREVRKAAPETAVLVLTMFDDDNTVFAADSAGAAGYPPNARTEPTSSPRGRPSSEQPGPPTPPRLVRPANRRTRGPVSRPDQPRTSDPRRRRRRTRAGRMSNSAHPWTVSLAPATCIRTTCPRDGTPVGMLGSVTGSERTALASVPRGCRLRDVGEMDGQRRVEVSASSAFAARRWRWMAR